MGKAHAACVEIVFPAHNEGASIAETLREFGEVLSARQGLEFTLVVSEDGSSDDTRSQVDAVAASMPVRMLPEAARKGYSKAVVDGLRSCTAPLVGFCDADGQYDPVDFLRLIDVIGDNDVAIGYRSPRVDSFFRRVISRAFRLPYEVLFPVRLHDPSSPFVLAKRTELNPVLSYSLGILRQGFWWEFNARAHAAGLRVVEIPVAHRSREGKTQVYRMNKIAGIAFEHLRGLFTLRRELRTHPSS